MELKTLLEATNLKFRTWQEAASYCFKKHIWGKVTIVLKGDYYVIEEK